MVNDEKAVRDSADYVDRAFGREFIDWDMREETRMMHDW